MPDIWVMPGKLQSLIFQKRFPDVESAFFLETASPFEAKFYVAPPWDGGTKVWSIGLGHMTKVAAWYSSTTKFVQTMTLGWPWLILRQGQIWSLMLLYGEKGKTMDFSDCPWHWTIYMYKSISTRCQVSLYGSLVLWFSFTIIVNPFLYGGSMTAGTPIPRKKKNTHTHTHKQNNKTFNA